MSYTKELNTIYSALKAGKRFGNFYAPSNPALTEPLFWEVLSMGTGRNGQNYIYWRHAGSSANKATKSDLYWIVHTIFKMSDREFLEKYCCID